MFIGDADTDAEFNAIDVGSLLSGLDVAGNDLSDGGTTIWDSSAGHVPASVVQKAGLDADTLDTHDSSEYALLAEDELVAGQWTFDANVAIGSDHTPTDAVDIHDPNATEVGLRIRDPTAPAYGWRWYFNDADSEMRLVTIEDGVEQPIFSANRANGLLHFQSDMKDGAGNVFYDQSAAHIPQARVQQGSGSGLDADTLDGIQLGAIDWGDVSMQTSDVNVSALGTADADLDMANQTIRFQPATAGGTAQALHFQSRGNASSDEAFIEYHDDYTYPGYISDGSTEQSALVLRAENDTIGGAGPDGIVLDAIGGTYIGRDDLHLDGSSLLGTSGETVYDASAGHVPANVVQTAGLDSDTVDGYEASELRNPKNIAQLTSTDTTTDINTTSWTSIPWDTAYTLDAGYTHDAATTPDTITFDEAGTFRITVSLAYDASGTRVNPGIKFNHNGTRLKTFGLSGYVRNSSGHDEGSNMVMRTITVAAGDTLQVQTTAMGNTSGTATLRAEESVLVIEQLSASVGMASDADTFDGLESSQFVRADQGDMLEGPLDFVHTSGHDTIQYTDNSGGALSVFTHRYDDKPLRFWTNTTAATTLYMDQNNRVGIQNTSPNYALDVSGIANVSGDVRVGGNLHLDADKHIELGLAYSEIYQRATDDRLVVSGHNGVDFTSYDGTNSTLVTDIRTSYGNVEIPNGGVDITAVGAHIDLIEADVTNNNWRIEAQGSQFKVTEVGVATHFTISEGGAASLNGNVNVGGNLDMSNGSVTNADHYAIADSGFRNGFMEGVVWPDGWSIGSAPNDLSNAAGNFQVAKGSTRMFTVDTGGQAEATGGYKTSNFEMVENSTTNSLDFNYVGA